MKKIASNHLYQVKAAMDIAALKEAVARFKERYGRLPAGPRPARDGRGLLASLPKDLDDKDYVYDPATGDVKRSDDLVETMNRVPHRPLSGWPGGASSTSSSTASRRE